MTVIPFKRPDQPKSPGDPLFFVTLYPNATHFSDPNRDEPDRRAATDALFDATFNVTKQTDDCVMLVMLGAERTDSLRVNHAFETEKQRAWLRRRLDSIYEQVTGRPRIRSRLAAFLTRLNRFSDAVVAFGRPRRLDTQGDDR